MSERLDQLTEMTADIHRRSLVLPAQLVQAEADFVEALKVGADARVVEAFRVRAASIYEAKLDLIGEAASVQRGLLEEARDNPPGGPK